MILKAIALRVPLLVLYYIVALGPNLMHSMYSFSLLNRYYPAKEIPRSFIVPFNIVSFFSWVCCAGLFFVLVLVLLGIDGNITAWDPIAIIVLIMFFILVLIIPFQLLSSYRVIGIIHENQKKNLLESFD